MVMLEKAKHEENLVKNDVPMSIYVSYY